jgi:hypothetical protein
MPVFLFAEFLLPFNTGNKKAGIASFFLSTTFNAYAHGDS